MMRNIAAGALMLAALMFWLGPTIGGTNDVGAHEDSLSAALSSDRLNNLRTEGAPQQQVVNGWTNRDLLEVQIRQTNDLLTAQSRQAALLAVAMFGIGLLAFSRPAQGTNTAAAPPSTDPTQPAPRSAHPVPPSSQQDPTP